MIRRLALLAAALLATAAATPTPPPPPPPVLAPYVKGETFDPGDYGWMRGRFADATAVQEAEWQAVQEWLIACRATRRAEVEAELRTLGIARPQLETTPLMPPLCIAVAFAMPNGIATAQYAAFAADLRSARPVVDTFLYAVARADKAAGHGSNLAEALMMRPVAEQMLRFAMSWGEGEDRGAPALTPGQRPIVMAAIGAETARTDHANTEWLKAIVALEGWPSISKVGERAAVEAWLLVQHADNDPAFQLKVLRLMAPLDDKHDLPRGNYAYLYDRVMLKLTGKQRYGTQATCRSGERVAEPLEDDRVAGWRTQAGLDPLEDYLAGMTRSFGRCPPEPIGPEPVGVAPPTR